MADLVIGLYLVVGLFATAGTGLWITQRCRAWYRRRVTRNWECGPSGNGHI